MNKGWGWEIKFVVTAEDTAGWKPAIRQVKNLRYNKKPRREPAGFAKLQPINAC
jgi:hypothetical protein